MAEVELPKRASVQEKKADEPKKKIFGEQKKPDRIIYRLVKQNDVKQREDTPLYPPYRRFPNKDIITWIYKDEDGEESEATREIRWLPGEQSIFVDEQEKDGRKIPDNILNNPNNRFEIIEGYIRVRPHEKTKIYFLDICNRNIDSEHRTGTVEALFSKYTEEMKSAEMTEKQDRQVEAMGKAAAATQEQVYAHAIKLNIPLINNLTQGSREYEAIRADYRQMAMDFPVEFMKVFES